MDIKELKEFEVKLNQKLTGKSVDGNLLEELLADMKAMEADGQTILVAFHKAEDGNIKASARVRTHTDIEGMSKTDWEERMAFRSNSDNLSSASNTSSYGLVCVVG